MSDFPDPTELRQLRLDAARKFDEKGRRQALEVLEAMHSLHPNSAGIEEALDVTLQAMAENGEVDLMERPGYAGAFCRVTGKNCWPRKTRVRKALSESDTETKVGTRGTVLGSMSAPDAGQFYFVEWDDKPRVAVGCIALKLERVEN